MSLLDKVNEKHHIVTDLHTQIGQKLMLIAELENVKTYQNIKKQLSALLDIRKLIDKKVMVEIELNEAQIEMHSDELKKFN